MRLCFGLTSQRGRHEQKRPFGECVVKGGEVVHPFEITIIKNYSKNYNETGSQAIHLRSLTFDVEMCSIAA